MPRVPSFHAVRAPFEYRRCVATLLAASVLICTNPAIAHAGEAPATASPTPNDPVESGLHELRLQIGRAIQLQSSARYFEAVEVWIQVLGQSELRSQESRLRGVVLSQLGRSYQALAAIDEEEKFLLKARAVYRQFLEELSSGASFNPLDQEDVQRNLIIVERALESTESEPIAAVPETTPSAEEPTTAPAPVVVASEIRPTKSKPGRGRIVGGSFLVVGSVLSTAIGVFGLYLGKQVVGEFRTAAGERRADVVARGRSANLLAAGGLTVGASLLAAGIVLLVKGKRQKKSGY